MIDASGYAREFPLTPKPGLLFQGPSGVGKTHLAVAVLRELVGRGFECMFFDYQNLLDKIRAGYNPAAGRRRTGSLSGCARHRGAAAR